jgi:hypothetical protein
MNTAAAIAALGLPGPLALYALMRNGQFPQPLTNDGQGNLTFNGAAITAFAALMTAATANGWTIPVTASVRELEHDGLDAARTLRPMPRADRWAAPARAVRLTPAATLWPVWPLSRT